MILVSDDAFAVCLCYRVAARSIGDSRIACEPRVDPYQTYLVQESYQQLSPMLHALVAAFYRQLSRLDESAHVWCPGTIAAQAQFVEFLAAIVAGLGSTTGLLPITQRLGRLAAQAGWRSRQYTTIGVALLAALRACLGASYTPEIEAAWARAYAMIAEMVQEAAMHD